MYQVMLYILVVVVLFVYIIKLIHIIHSIQDWVDVYYKAYIVLNTEVFAFQRVGLEGLPTVIRCSSSS